ncbi:MAG: hypothetical protein AB7L65_09125 [Hyphomonadaceae bacterium]
MRLPIAIPPELRVLLGRPLRDAAANENLLSLRGQHVETIGERVYVTIGRGEVVLHGDLTRFEASAVFVYGPGQWNRRNKGYPRPLPGGVTWAFTRAEVLAALGQPDDHIRDSRGLSDRYNTGPLCVSFDYADERAPVHMIGVFFQ